MKRLARVLGVGTCAAVALTIAGCGSSSDDDSGGSSAGGGTLTIGMSITTSSMNPALTVGNYTYYSYDPVIYQSADGSFEPDLATDWGYTDDTNTAFSFTLREGMTFADGNAVTADAVVASMQYFLTAGGVNTTYAGPVASIEATDADTVQINYSAPFPDAVVSLTQDQGFGLIIGPDGLADPDSLETTSDGVGHYVLDAASTVKDSVYTFLPDENYFNQDAIRYDKVELKPLPDPSAQLAALQSGQIQYAHRVTATNVEAATSSGATLTQGAAAVQLLSLMDQTTGPLADPRVRQALQLAVDRESIVSAIFGGYGQAQSQIAVEGQDGYVASEEDTYAYDLDRAQQLLTEAGYGDGFTLSLIEPGQIDPNGVLAQAVASEWAEIGVTLDITTESGAFPQYFAELQSKNYQINLFPATVTDLYTQASQLLTPGSQYNVFGNTDAEASGLLSAVASSTGDAQQANLEQLNQRIDELGWFVPIGVQFSNAVVDSSVQNVASSFVTQDIDPVSPVTEENWYSEG